MCPVYGVILANPRCHTHWYRYFHLRLWYVTRYISVETYPVVVHFGIMFFFCVVLGFVCYVFDEILFAVFSTLFFYCPTCFCSHDLFSVVFALLLLMLGTCLHNVLRFSFFLCVVISPPTPPTFLIVLFLPFSWRVPCLCLVCCLLMVYVDNVVDLRFCPCGFWFNCLQILLIFAFWSHHPPHVHSLLCYLCLHRSTPVYPYASTCTHLHPYLPICIHFFSINWCFSCFCWFTPSPNLCVSSPLLPTPLFPVLPHHHTHVKSSVSASDHPWPPMTISNPTLLPPIPCTTSGNFPVHTTL